MGTATSGLTFFQQVGGTVGLAITGTIFGTTMAEEVPRQLAAASVPEQIAQGFANSGFDPNQVGVGDLGATILAGVPEQFRAMVEPFIPAIVGAIEQAFSIATAATFYPGIITAAIAAGLVLLLREVPIREHAPEEEVGATAAGRAIAEPAD
jgi:hypothetical protein